MDVTPKHPTYTLCLKEDIKKYLPPNKTLPPDTSKDLIYKTFLPPVPDTSADDAWNLVTALLRLPQLRSGLFGQKTDENNLTPLLNIIQATGMGLPQMMLAPKEPADSSSASALPDMERGWHFDFERVC